VSNPMFDHCPKMSDPMFDHCPRMSNLMLEQSSHLNVGSEDNGSLFTGMDVKNVTCSRIFLRIQSYKENHLTMFSEVKQKVRNFFYDIFVPKILPFKVTKLYIIKLHSKNEVTFK
jgi:hypothetical protein